MTNHVVLFEPEIPENTGNIARTCAGSNTVLHLIEPLGFKLNDKNMKRAGLDYWDNVKLVLHDDLNSFLTTLKETDELFLISKFSSKNYAQINYQDPKKDYYFMFGRETTGLPETYMKQNADKAVRIPMADKIRSYNLANSVAIVLFEALRQQDFPGMEESHHYEHDKLKD